MGEQVFQKLHDRAQLDASPLLVFAADPDCGGGLRCFGDNADGSPRNRPGFLRLCREMVRDGAVDGVLLSPLSASILAVDANFFEVYPAQPIVRFNAETAVWGPRGGSYRASFSRPFTPVNLADQNLSVDVKLGLYSITLNGDIESDHRTLTAYLDFAREVCNSKSWQHFLEVFPPQTEADAPINAEMSGEFIADSMVRILSHLTRRERPLFLKTTFTTPKLWRELCDFDPDVVVGALGGARKSTFETLQLAQNVVEGGGRAILFGRNIFQDPKPRLLCRLLRQVLDRKLDSSDALELYNREN